MHFFFLFCVYFSFSQEEISLIDFAKGDYPIRKKVKIIYNKSLNTENVS